MPIVKHLVKRWFKFFCVVCVTSFAFSCTSTPERPRVLIYSDVKGGHYESVPAGIAAIQKLGQKNGFHVDTTKDASYFHEDSLQNYRAVVFLSISPNALDIHQQIAFERFIQAGGGYIGIHAAANMQPNWYWYNKLVGANFSTFSNIQKATIKIKDKNHPSTSFLPESWIRTDEWYSFKNINSEMNVLATLDEESYEEGQNGVEYPIAWYQKFDGGRAFYTGGGHTAESYSEPFFLQHVLGGIKYAIGRKDLDYTKAYTNKAPEENRFTKRILANDLNEPMELAVAPDGRVFFIERAGKLYMYDSELNKTRLLHQFNFSDKALNSLNGLLGITLDPDFNKNRFIYLFYTNDKNDQFRQHISRFTLNPEGTLDLESERVIIEIPVDVSGRTHTGGSLTWDKFNNLYISTGDNTAATAFAPIDERKGRSNFDAQRSSGNANDLRGKILRIHPTADGTYTIPEGNLFPQGTPGTRPEIYIMGCRNPYRISVDPLTSYLYWGDIGPDAGTDGIRGPKGYDELNQAKRAGNYGWPYFIGDNQAYKNYDYTSEVVGDPFNPNSPVNNSPNNTGIKNLPPAQKALIWYSYERSEKFPELGTGGRSAMAGPIYHYDADLQSDIKLPEYYDKKVFMYDWMRNWVYSIDLNENHNYVRMQPFMPETGDFRRPIEMELGPDGAIYILEYGSVYGKDNDDARLVRIGYKTGNRAPVAKITTNDTLGIAPFTARFSSSNSYDFDKDDKLTYEWRFDENKVVSRAPNPSFTFQKNGIHQVILKVSDAGGESEMDTIQVQIGNTLPRVSIHSTSNSSFFFPEATPFSYAVNVEDNEDPVIEKKKIRISLRYLPNIKDNPTTSELEKLTSFFNPGKILLENSDCKACHQLNEKSIGPAFMEISKRYQNDENAVTTLANKVIQGGGGNWGPDIMNAHPQLTEEESKEIVKYILSLSKKSLYSNLPIKGTVNLTEHIGKDQKGRYILTASYTDKGGAVASLTATEALVLRPARVQAEDVTIFSHINKKGDNLEFVNDKSHFVLKDIDLNEIKQLKYRFSSRLNSAAIQVKLDSLTGPAISTMNYEETGSWNKFKEQETAIKSIKGKHTLYFVIAGNNLSKEQGPLLYLDWVQFQK
jgi:cytochrome c